MTDKFDEILFDGMLKAAFNEKFEEEAAQYPPDEELTKLYPMPKKLKMEIQRRLDKKNRRTPKYVIYLKRAAVIALVLVSVSFATLMTSAQVRDAVVSWFGDFINFDFSPKEEVGKFEATSIDELSIEYIPEGFELVSEVDDNEAYFAYYMNSSNQHIMISFAETDISDVSTDIEKHNYSKIEINSYYVYITYDDNQMNGTIIWGNENLTVNVAASASREELIKIAKGIKTQGK